MDKKASLLWGLFLLRFGLGIFLALWAIDKFVAPEHTVRMFSEIYFLSINTSLAAMIGAVQLVISLLLLLGMYKTIIYGLALIIHTISTIAIYHTMVSPFGSNDIFFGEIPIFFAFLTLFLLREFDTKWSLGRKKSIFA